MLVACSPCCQNAVEQCGIESLYVSLFERQKGSVLTDKESDVFERRKKRSRATSLSRQVALKDDRINWQRKGMGIRLGDSVSDCLTNLRFADDVLLLQHH